MSSTNFVSQLGKACDDAGFDSLSVIEEINGMVRPSDVVGHYIVVGPLPEFPDTKLDVFLLTQDCLYNYVRSEEGPSTWGVLPLARISYMSERVLGAPDHISLVISGMTDQGLVIQEELARKDVLDDFLSSLNRRTLDVLKVSE